MLTKTIIHYDEYMVPIDKAAPLLDLQMRVETHEDTIAEYAEAMKEGSIFPPIDCADLDGQLDIYDGFLRHAAYRRLGVAEIKVRVRQAECMDDVVLWAVQANAHEGKRRTNADKQKSVQALLATEKYCDMPTTAVALAAGVADETVRRYRVQQQKSSDSIHNVDSDSSKKVRTARGLRPATYRTKKRKAKSKPMGSLPYEKIVWPTPEERKLPPPELMNEPHPDHPGFTYMQIHVREHGFVQIMPVDKKAKQERDMATRELIGLVRDVGTMCKPLAGAIDKITVNDLVNTINEMDDKTKAVWVRKLNQHRDELETVIPYIKSLLDATRETA